MTKKMTKKEQSGVTREKLIIAATEEFWKKGYGKASTEKIVKQAGVTRGALYHHFKDKKELFFAVFTAAQLAIGNFIENEANKSDNNWQALQMGCDAFLSICSRPDIQQIVLRDGPSILEWSKIRNLDSSMEDSGLNLLKECLKELIEEQEIAALPVEALAHILSGAMDEAAMWIAQSDNKEKAFKDAQISIARLLEGLKIK